MPPAPPVYPQMSKGIFEQGDLFWLYDYNLGWCSVILQNVGDHSCSADVIEMFLFAVYNKQ